MKKKLLIILLILALLGVGAALYLYNMDWGGRESTIEKVKIEPVVQDDADASKVSLSAITGTYAALSKDGNAELLFAMEGLKDTKGAFEDISIDFDIKEDFETSSLNVVIKAASINTENEMRDEHLAAEEYFNVEKFPEITFNSSEISFKEGVYTAKGKLDFLGNSNDLNITFKHAGAAESEGTTLQVFEGNFTFDRTKYGMEEEKGIGNELTVTFYAKMKK
jgi:polyisoprenoid-binding protein YceI